MKAPQIKFLNSIWIFLLFMGSPVLSVNNYYFNFINSEDGLSQMEVKSILQDSNGFIWFGTRNKLNRYDGKTCKTFDCIDTIAQRQNNNISALHEDNRLNLWVGTDKGVFIFNPKTSLFTFQDIDSKEGIKMLDWVSDIQSDQDGNIWIIIPNQGVFRYITMERSLRFYKFGQDSIPDHGSPQSICIDQSNKVWIGTNGKGVYLYNRDTDQFTQYLGNSTGNATLENENIYAMADDGEYLVLGIHEGKLRKINKRRNSVADMDTPDVHYKIIRCITKIGNELWVGTQSGIYVIKSNGETFRIYNDPMCNYSLSDNQVGKIYQDKEGGIWIGTYVGGVNYLSKAMANFSRYKPSNRPHSINSKRIREIIEDHEHNIWVGTEDEGINIFSPKKQQFKVFNDKSPNKLSSNQTLSMLQLNGDIWVGLFKKGLNIISCKDHTVKSYSVDQLRLNEASIYAICEDKHGNIWLGNGWGVYKGNKHDMRFTNLPQFGLSYIYDIIEDSNGQIWVATMGNGVFRHDPYSNKTEHYKHRINDPHSLSSNSVSSITETSKGEIWFATDRGGICRYDKDRNNFHTISIAQGLPDDTSYKIVEDKNGYLWFGTNNGLIRLNPNNSEIQTYSTYNGLPTNQFCYKSALASSTGELFFGTTDGLISFFPDQLAANQFIPPVYITNINYNNKERGEKRSSGSLSYHEYALPNHVTLEHDQNNINLSFVALSYTCPKANLYAYKLENIDEEWVYTRDNTSASYANLPPGKYKFIVKASNNDLTWNKKGAQLNITILPPWWQTPCAYIAYTLAFILIIGSISKYYLYKNKKRNEEKRLLFESEKENELYNSKIDFFTNIAHEIRTPLTLINGPLESLAEMDIKNPEARKDIHLMQKNIGELFVLINQILDFRKIDANKMGINPTDCNVTTITSDLYQEFLPTALSTHKQIEFQKPGSNIYAHIDKEAFIKILNNLLSNAIKYSKDKIEITLSEGDNNFTFCIKNDGETIPPDMAEKIFDPFFQIKRSTHINASSGIGLSVARSLTELHNGTLEYKCENGLNVFELIIPKGEITLHDNNTIEILNDEIDDDASNDKEAILIVEDNVELLAFMAEKLGKSFAVEKATNGAEALKIMERKNFDIVISDIMMPIMDGIEFCKKLKGNIELCHIPIILLTAKNDLSSKIQGLEAGADAYIEKPFSFKYLLTRIHSLLENRKREKEAFTRKPYMTTQSMELCKADEELMQEIISIIIDNMADSNFGVERLCEITKMSRSSLHRKIKALTGGSPTDFIRIVRLKKAAELITEGKYKISEICYIVGINSPSYFIRVFQKQFGITPKEFEHQQIDYQLKQFNINKIKT